MPETVVHFQIRMPPDLYEKLTSWAKDDKESINALVVDGCDRASAKDFHEIRAVFTRGVA